MRGMALERTVDGVPISWSSRYTYTYLINTEYFRSARGPVAKHNSTVPANPVVALASFTRRVTSSLHLICKHTIMSTYNVEEEFFSR